MSGLRPDWTERVVAGDAIAGLTNHKCDVRWIYMKKQTRRLSKSEIMLPCGLSDELYCISINKRKNIIPQAKQSSRHEQKNVTDLYYLGVKIMDYSRNKQGVGIIVKLENGEELDVSIMEWMTNISMN